MGQRESLGRACIAIGASVFLVATALLVRRSIEPPVSSDAMIALGEERLAGGDLAGAREWFGKAARSAPDAGPRARAAEARVLELQGDLAAALEVYRAAAEAAPSEVEPTLVLSRALARAGRMQEARQTLEEASRRSPGSPEPLVELAALDLGASDLAAASMMYHRIEERFPDEVRGPLGVAAVAEASGDAGEARPAYERAARVDERSVPAWEGIGRVAAATGDFEAAEGAYRRVVALRPDDATALTVHATLIERRGRYEEAARLFRQAITLLEGGTGEEREARALASTGLGTCLLALGRSDEAYEALAAALTDEPGQPEASWALAPIYLEREEWQSALRALRRTIPRRGEDPLLWVMLGRAEAGQGRWAEARQAFTFALELDEDHLEARRWLGISLRALGAYRAAEATLEEVVRERPDDDLATLNLAIALGQLGEPQRALRLFSRARSLAPDRPEPLYHEAHLMLALGRGAPAVELARRAVALAPGDPGALEVLARALEATDQREEALRHARHARAVARDDAQRQYLDGLVSRLEGTGRDES